MDFIKDHATPLVALLSVVTVLLGTWLGARIQAGGGLAQAKAAKEAAETAAAATLQAVREQADRAAAAAHAASLHDQQITAIASLLRSVREFTRAVDRLYMEPDTDAVDSAYDDLAHAQGAVELIAPTSLTAASARVMETTQNLDGLARDRAEAERARMKLANMHGYLPDVMGVSRAWEALAAYRAAWMADDTDALKTEVDSALSQLSRLTPEERIALVIDCTLPELEPMLAQRRQDHGEAMTEFINQARDALGVSDQPSPPA